MMIGCTIEEFLQEILKLDHSEVTFAFRGKKYRMQKTFKPITDEWVLYLDEYESLETDSECLCSYTFWGDDNATRTHRFETRRIFDGQNIREVEQEIMVFREKTGG